MDGDSRWIVIASGFGAVLCFLIDLFAAILFSVHDSIIDPIERKIAKCHRKQHLIFFAVSGTMLFIAGLAFAVYFFTHR